MLRFLRHLVRRRQRGRPPAAPDPGDRSTGDDVLESRQALADESTTPGTPRLKTRNL